MGFFINPLIRLINYHVTMEKRTNVMAWKQDFLDDLFEGTDIAPKPISGDFEVRFMEALSILSNRDANILKRHYADGVSYAEIAREAGVTRACIWKHASESLYQIRKSPYLYSLAYGKEYMELYDMIKTNGNLISTLQAKNDLLKIFREIAGAKDIRLKDIELDNETKAIFQKLVIENAEELLSFSLKDYIILAGAVIGDRNAKEKLEKYRTSHEYARCLSVDEVGLSKRSVNCLHRNGVLTLGDICQHTYTELKSFRYLGEQSLDEVTKKIKEYNLILKT